MGPLATIDCEPRQARKGAAVTIDAGAGVWLLGLPPYFKFLFSYRPLDGKMKSSTVKLFLSQVLPYALYCTGA